MKMQEKGIDTTEADPILSPASININKINK
jgi:hypothetical protein